MPDPRATPLHVSPLQHDVLHQLERRSTSPQRLVRRGKITQDLHVDSDTVRLWRERGPAAEARLQAIEATGKPKLLKQAIEALLTDEQRPGAPARFTFEQFMQILALACEKPEATDREVEYLDTARTSR